jgi:uncharacterized protein YvpB
VTTPVHGRRSAAALALLLALTACAGTPQDAEMARARRTGASLSGSPQSRNLTCESRSAADLLAAHGLAASEREVFERLPRTDNPDTGFVGSADDEAGGLPPAGYGVHAPPIAAALRDLGLDARVESGRDLAWLAAETAAGRPVIAWVTGSCEPSRVVPMRDRAGREFRAVPGEHTVLVLRVGPGKVYALDPATGRCREFDRQAFLEVWRLFGGAAVSASGPLAAPTTGEGRVRSPGGSVPR